MNEQLTKLRDSFKQFWTSQSKKRKIIILSSIGAVIVIAVIVTAILNHKDYVVLFEGLESTEASEIVSQIQDMGYDVNLKSNGTIMVPEGTENSLTMSMAELGYPKSGLTYDLYTKNISMFTTESEKKEYSRMALEDRLSAIVGSLEGVNKATVTLSIPEQKNTVITTNKQYPTASVVVYLEPNLKLSNDQIKGITHIVKMSYTGLTDDNISIVDGYGIPQIAGEEDIDVIADETRKFAFKTNLENSIKEKILELLTPVYNDDGVSVAVNMVLNFDDKVSEDTKYTPSNEDGKGMLQHETGSSASGNQVSEDGVVGEEVNADDTYPTGTTNSNDGAWTEASTDNTYLINTYKEQVEKAGYTIDNLSISVMIYTDYLPETTKQELVSLVANAGSVNPQYASDVVTVTNLPKYTDSLVPASTQPTYLFGLTLNQLLIIGGVLVLLLIVLIVMLVIMSNRAKAKRRQFEEQLLASQAVAGDGEAVDGFFNMTAGGDGEKVNIPSLTDTQEMDTKEVQVRREIAEFAKQSPEIVATLLRNWMREDEEGGQKKNG
jgi:flagellar M-ring protein FliF